jgi:methylmalonyl-CoA mutase C-terminal domain/subunit
VLIAKPGLDGHDRGAKVVALALRQAGFEVIYSGLHQTIEEIVQAAAQEDVAVLGLSVLSGAHLPIAQKLMASLGKLGLRPLVLFGGNIPQADVAALTTLGVEGVFPTGSRFEEMVAFIRQRVGMETARTGDARRQ